MERGRGPAGGGLMVLVNDMYRGGGREGISQL